MEKNNWFVKVFDDVFSSWAPPNVIEATSAFEKMFLEFVNPELKNRGSPTEEYLMTGFLPTISMAGFYLLTIFSLTIIMKTISSEQPKEQKKKVMVPLATKFSKEPILLVALLYNVVQVVLCSYMVLRTIFVALDNGYYLSCNYFNMDDASMAKVYWVFYLSKALDFFDTFLIVVRRKWRQLSFLHVYHHTSIFLLSWVNLRAGYHGDIYLPMLLNAGVHVVMYAYYFFVALNFKVPIVLKKSVTYLQLLQFVTLLIQALYLLYNNCPYPRRIVYIYFFYIGSLFLLFLNFFIVNYMKGDNSKKKKKTQ